MSPARTDYASGKGEMVVGLLAYSPPKSYF